VSRLSVACAAAAVLALTLTRTGVARAQERGEQREQREKRAAEQRESVWTIDGRVGYAAAWSTGVSHLGVGEGLAVGRTWASGIHLELQGFHFQGAEVTASNAVLRYRASYSSLQLQGAAGYDFALGALRIRPSLCTGFAFVDGKTVVGAAKESDDITRWQVGPSLTVLVRVSRFVIGVDGQAFFVPSTVAAPSLGLYGVFGIVL
jgi:hypothetical protein